MTIKEGQKAPEFKLKSTNGKEISLIELKGKTVVLYFYPKDLTTGCTQESCDFRDNWNKFKKKNVIVLGISKDSIESHQKFITKHGLNFPLLSDEEGKMCMAYGVWKEKSMYGRKYMGIVRTTFVIDPNGKVQKIYPKVKVSGHVDEVLGDLS